MGYDVHITRRTPFWDEEGEAITAGEWAAVVEADPELAFAGAAVAATGNDEALVCTNPLLACMTTHPEAGGEGAWLDFRDGTVTVKNPDAVLLVKTKAVAALLGATVQGDDGEFHPL
ncbi:hypothetical protein ABZO31_30430 [Streptomyces sp. HUAS MG47]|uniref:hypothetical protein n=1 Tax=Streptomyces solicamelliae TaxID=3231716 RepID=UPI0038783E43